MKEIQVVNSGEHGPEDLVRLEEVPEIGTGVVPAGMAGASGIDGFMIRLEPFPFHGDKAVPGENSAVLAIRVGRTQSNRSIPFSTAIRMYSGVPMPMR
jgi:hypothetical protein